MLLQDTNIKKRAFNISINIQNNDNAICPPVIYHINLTIPNTWNYQCIFPELLVGPQVLILFSTFKFVFKMSCNILCTLSYPEDIISTITPFTVFITKNYSKLCR